MLVWACRRTALARASSAYDANCRAELERRMRDRAVVMPTNAKEASTTITATTMSICTRVNPSSLLRVRLFRVFEGKRLRIKSDPEAALSCETCESEDLPSLPEQKLPIRPARLALGVALLLFTDTPRIRGTIRVTRMRLG